MNLVVALDTVRDRDDWNKFDARVKSERAVCPRVTLTEPQLETLRRSVSEAAVCGPPRVRGSSDDGADAGATAGSVIGGLVCFAILTCCCWECCGKQEFSETTPGELGRSPDRSGVHY